MDKVIAGFALFLGIMALVIGWSLLWTWPLMLIINYVFTPTTLIAVIGTSQITFWKTFWLSVACSSLFKSTQVNNK